MNLVRQPSRTIVNSRANPLQEPTTRRIKQPKYSHLSNLSKLKKGKVSVKEKQASKENANPNAKLLKKKSHKRNTSVPLLRQYNSAQVHSARNQLHQLKSSLLCGQTLRIINTPTPQPEEKPSLSWIQRAKSVNLLMKECFQRCLSRQTLYLAISILDRVNKVSQPGTKESLRGRTYACLLISSKIEEVRPLSIFDFSPPITEFKSRQLQISRLLQYVLVIPTLQNQFDELALLWDKFVQGVMLPQLTLRANTLIRLRMQQLVDLTALQVNSKNHSSTILLNSCLYLAVGYVLDNSLFGQSNIMFLREGSLFLYQQIATNNLFSTFIGISMQADLQDLLPCLQFVMGFGVLSAEVQPDALWQRLAIQVIQQRTRLLNQ